ncbi:phosphorylated adapter RNA export protein [Leptopilina boulardi]|uniref:phosphorylated adapter RNA export protein n=1 Tax=Leptopilina boulardi TaxID=63433 RepID=UPI0021F59254|nr:phosphorylated adapter RNA export protein [Leptopilina boulardi]XP_051161034.1 phosphorylated adapter RNA export protein [Leptopilina boulardi]XP_051161035.1 phosphorylated adapter RNA export protein [Leptopilina boulardi]
MEAESLDLEDGEVLDDEPEDAFGTYNVLQRPHAIQSSRDEIGNKMKYSDDESDDVTLESSDSDSDSDTTARLKTKRPKIKIKPKRTERVDNLCRNKNKNDKFKIWNMQVQEESITEDLVSCGVTRNNYTDRTVESYDFTLGYSFKKKREELSKLNNDDDDDDDDDDDNNSSDEERNNEPRLTNKRNYAERRNVKLRLGKRRQNNTNNVDDDDDDDDDHKGSSRVMSDLNVNLESSDADVAADIAAKLSEHKDVLIRRIVDILGKEKAIDFFQKTKKIEQEGGMLIMNGSRRRTAGGVYLYLVKNDDHLPQEKIREIFYVDRKEIEKQKKQQDANERRRQTKELMRRLENGSDKDLPALLTRAELSTKQIAEEARLRRGEGMDRTPLDSERTVSNPPPSPVTDDPDHSEHPTPGRQEIDYEDILDIGDVDNMEVF